MSLNIVSIYNNGDAKQEYVVLQALEDVNIHNYAVVDRTFNKSGSLSNIHRHFYRFPSATIKKGNYVAICTGEGTSNSNGNYKNLPCAIYYWGSKAPFWNDTNVEQAELLQVATIQTKNTA